MPRDSRVGSRLDREPAGRAAAMRAASRAVPFAADVDELAVLDLDDPFRRGAQ
jgi:hypothetical protein